MYWKTQLRSVTWETAKDIEVIQLRTSVDILLGLECLELELGCAGKTSRLLAVSCRLVSPFTAAVEPRSVSETVVDCRTSWPAKLALNFLRGTSADLVPSVGSAAADEDDEAVRPIGTTAASRRFRRYGR